MSNQAGWLRLWTLITVGMVLFYGWQTFQTRNISEMTGTSWYCIPGTYSKEMKTYQDGWTEPTEQEISAQIKKGNIFGEVEQDESIARIAARISLKQAKYKSVSVFSCTSFGKLFSNLALALMWSALLVIAFLAIQWVAKGFRSDKA